MIKRLCTCEHCKRRYLILKSEINSFIPVEVPEFADTFAPKIHISHLKNCSELAKHWSKIKHEIRSVSKRQKADR